MYDDYLPYRFHLEMVASLADRFMHLIPNTEGPGNKYAVYVAAYAHDTIEDCRVTYNDVKEALGYEVAEIVYALSNEKGKNRKERANAKYYQGILDTPGAVFVKMCDRMANAAYSKMTGSRMLEMYRKENPAFTEALGFRKDGVEYPGHPLYPMFKELRNILEE